jgi:hypothetical protein
MAEVNYAYGEAPVEVSTSSNYASPAEILTIANKIWKIVQETKPISDAESDALLEKLQAEYKDFNTGFPLALRWMVQMKKYKPRAFEKYLTKYAATKLDSREAFLEIQAEYLIFLYREEHSHPDESYIREYRKNIVKQLLDEDKAFIEINKQVEEDIAKKDAEYDQDRRQKLYEFLLSQKVKAAMDLKTAE